MIVDWTINLGHIITILGFVVGGLGFAMTIRGDVTSLRSNETNMAERLDIVERDIRRMTDVLVQIGRQDERLNSHSQRLTVLERHFSEHILGGKPP